MIVSCVRVGLKYGVEYVLRLRDMVARHLPIDYRFVCLTDAPADLEPLGIECLDVSHLQLSRWWPKMYLFADWRADEPMVYLDLDTVIVGDLTPLAARTAFRFSTCANFTRAAGNLAWPCKYGTCVMTFGPQSMASVWTRFDQDRARLMQDYARFGDQRVVEKLVPDALLLQQCLPADYFIGYRDLPQYPGAAPAGCSIVVFGGKNKPDNCGVPWVTREWTR